MTYIFIYTCDHSRHYWGGRASWWLPRSSFSVSAAAAFVSCSWIFRMLSKLGACLADTEDVRVLDDVVILFVVVVVVAIVMRWQWCGVFFLRRSYVSFWPRYLLDSVLPFQTAVSLGGILF